MLTLHYTTLHASMIEKATEVGSEVGKSLQKKERPRHAKAKEKENVRPSMKIDVTAGDAT